VQTLNSTFSFRLKNYRCFADTLPATIEVGPGFTALVGPNNSGKSAYLKFLYEFQPLWNELRNPSVLAHFQTNPTNPRGIARPRGLVDVLEVLSDFTDRPLGIDIQLQEVINRGEHLRALSLQAGPSDPLSWRGQLSFSPNAETQIRAEGGGLLDRVGKPVNIQPFLELFEVLPACLFAPAFRNAINEGAGDYYGLAIGTGLVALWNQWKTGDARGSKIAIQRITEDIRHIFGFKSLEINASADGKTLDVVVAGRPYRLNDLGSGLSQFIILFANAAIKRPAMILLDEPELNLHPSLQIDFLTSLASYASSGVVVFATHSIGLARAVADRIYTFSPRPEGTAVAPFERTPNYSEFAGELSFSSFRELGFTHLLMVEGPSEVKTVQQLLRLLGRDHQIVVLHLGGGSMITRGRAVELGELKRITESVSVLIDSEISREDGEIDPNRKAFMEDCKALGFRVHATKRRAFENYLPDSAIKSVKGDKYRALGPYEHLSSANPAWAKAENWLIARRISEKELLETDVGEFLATIVPLA